MATKAYSEFLPEVLPRSPATPDVVAINAIRNAAIELCSRSGVWSELLDTMTVSGSDMPVVLDAPNGARVDSIVELKVNGVPIDAKTIAEISLEIPDWENATGDPAAYLLPSPDAIQLVPSPAVPVTVRLRVAYTPTRKSSGVVDFVYERYLEPIAAGALFRLSGDVGYSVLYEAGVRQATADATKSFSPAVLRTRRWGV